MVKEQQNIMDLKKSIDTLFPYEEYRENQKETIIKIIKSFETKRFVVLDAPTGSGKSVIGMTIARYFKRAHILTIQKILQNQYRRDFSNLGLFIMKGRGNYTCSLNGNSCAEGYCKLNKNKPNDHMCPYISARIKAEKCNFTNHNFDSFFYQRIFFTKRPLMIIDEAHNIEQKFMNFISLKIDNELIPIDIPEYEDTIKYVDFCRMYLKIVNNELENMEAKDEWNREQIKFFEDLQRLEWKLRTFISSYSSEPKIEYIHEYKEKQNIQKLVLKPVRVSNFTEMLFNYADKILCMSATILNGEQFSINSGIPEDEYDYIQMPCTFPIENRIIQYTGELDLKYKKLPVEIKKVPEVLNRYLKMYNEERGIIHTHTNVLVNYIKKNLRSNRLIFKDDFSNTDDLLRVHAQRENSVIVASGFHEGLDLKDDLSRFQLILKVPYPDLSDKQLKKRMEVDKTYYGYLTALKIVQSYGRSVRSDEDWCDTYVLDKNFRMFYGMYKKMLPDFFREAIEWQ